MHTFNRITVELPLIEGKDIAEIFDSEYRLSATIHGGITVYEETSVCQQSSSSSLSVPSGSTATDAILLNG